MKWVTRRPAYRRFFRWHSWMRGSRAPSQRPHSLAAKARSLGKSEGGLWRRVIAGQKPACIAGRGTISEASCCAEVALVRARLDDLGDLRGRVPQLVVRVVVVRPEPQPGIRAEVAQNLPLGELRVHGLELRGADRDRAAAPAGVPRAADLEPRLVEELDQELCLSY